MKDTPDQWHTASVALAEDPVKALAYIASRPEDYDRLGTLLANPQNKINMYLAHTIDDDTGIVTHTATQRPCLNMACFKAFILARYW